MDRSSFELISKNSIECLFLNLQIQVAFNNHAFHLLAECSVKLIHRADI